MKRRRNSVSVDVEGYESEEEEEEEEEAEEGSERQAEEEEEEEQKMVVVEQEEGTENLEKDQPRKSVTCEAIAVFNLAFNSIY